MSTLTEGWCYENNITGYPAVWAGFLTAVGAAEKTLTPQQQRMTSCNQQATAQALKGDARKTYMSDCLKTVNPSQVRKA